MSNGHARSGCGDTKGCELLGGHSGPCGTEVDSLRAEVARLKAERDARPSPEVVAEVREALEGMIEWAEAGAVLNKHLALRDADVVSARAALVKLPKGGG